MYTHFLRIARTRILQFGKKNTHTHISPDYVHLIVRTTTKPTYMKKTQLLTFPLSLTLNHNAILNGNLIGSCAVFVSFCCRLCNPVNMVFLTFKRKSTVNQLMIQYDTWLYNINSFYTCAILPFIHTQTNGSFDHFNLYIS